MYRRLIAPQEHIREDTGTVILAARIIITDTEAPEDIMHHQGDTVRSEDTETTILITHIVCLIPSINTIIKQVPFL